MRLSSLCAAAVTAILASGAGVAEGGTVYIGSGLDSDNRAVSGSVDVTFDANANTLTLVLTNTTAYTYCAAELLTAFRFDLTGVTGNGTLSSAWAYSRDVDTNGVYDDSDDLLNLLIPTKTWELVKNDGDPFSLQFTPNAEFALLGQAESDNNYSTANGSIKGNNGHNPFARQTATFVISFTDVTASAAITDLDLRFGTSFAGSVTPVVVVPLPPAVLLGLGLMGGLGAVRAIRRRRRPEF